MKKLLFLGLLICLICPIQVLAGEIPQNNQLPGAELSLGGDLGFGSSLRWSVDFLWGSKSKDGKPLEWFQVLTIGPTGGGFNSVRYFKGERITIQSRGMGALVGYWSNKEKRRLLGWHGYAILGVAYTKVASEKYNVDLDYIRYSKFGLGLDWYLIRKYPGYSMSITTEATSALQTVGLTLKNKIGKAGEIKPNFIKDGSLHIGLRFWF